MNNRQNGRRRGRGGGAPRPNGGGGNMGNERGSRIDNRSRGNATQLHEKYKTLARDAQTQGDRVMTEYYLQFADHYFRVLAETRPRFEEQQRRQRDDQFDDYEEGDGEMEAGGDDRDQPQSPPQQQRREQPQPRYEQRDTQRENRGETRSENGRDERDDGGSDGRNDGPAYRSETRAEPRAEGEDPARGRRRNRREFTERRPQEANGNVANGADDAEAPRLDADRLPPAFARAPEPIEAAAPVAGVEGEPYDTPPPAPRRPRRPRRPQGGDEATVAVEA